MWLLVLVAVGSLAAVFVLGRDRFQLPGAAPRSVDTLPDTQLEENARARIAREPDTRDAEVTVIVREQVATVSGRVPTVAVREKVLNVVRMTPNVAGVIDRVIVTETVVPPK